MADTASENCRQLHGVGIQLSAGWMGTETVYLYSRIKQFDPSTVFLGSYSFTLEGPAFGSSREAGCIADRDRLTKMQELFAGVGIEKQLQICSMSPTKQNEILPFKTGDAGDLMRREIAVGSSQETSAARGC